jgi:hypothetical protein
MASDRTRAAVFAALGAANAEYDDHVWIVLDALIDAIDAGPDQLESLVHAVNEWDADHGSEPSPAWSRPHDGRPSR